MRILPYRLNPGENLVSIGSLTSLDGRSTLVIQADGNLVLYWSDGSAPWASNTVGRTVTEAVMQGDGNFVMYGPGGEYIWDTSTNGHPGAWLILQDDGNAVIYDPAGNPLWATNTMWVTVRGFLPSTSGFHFPNSFPMNSFPGISMLGGVFRVSGIYGLCGGMAFAARDYFETSLPTPPNTAPPTSGPLFDYLWLRLLASFNLLLGPTRYIHLMDPMLPDHETELSRRGLAPHGRAWVMIAEEWPKIKADIDSGHPSSIGLVTVKSADPTRIFSNHQVLVYGYKLVEQNLRLLVYDPNHENQDDAAITLSLANPENTTPVAYSRPLPGGSDGVIWCFFRPDYVRSTPPPPTLPSRRVLVVVQENTGKLTFMPKSVPQRITSAIETAIDRLAETFEDVKVRLQAGGKYDRVVLLTDDACKRANLLDTLVTETQSGNTIDIVVLGHGTREWLGLKGEALTGGQSGNIRTLMQEAAGRGCPSLNIRLVYMCNCYGSTVNDDWLAIGAKASVGSRRINYLPEPMTTVFLQLWVEGKSAGDAAVHSYNAAKGIFEPVFAALRLLNLQRIRNSLRTAVAQSEPLVAGDAGVTFQWAY